MSARRARAVLGAALIVILAGCAMGPEPAASDPPAATTAPTSSSSAPGPGESPTPGPDAGPGDRFDCENVLDPVEYERLAETGMVFHPEGRPIGQAGIDLLDEGALSCTWAAPESDVVLWVARLPESDAAWEARRAALLAEGWAETDGPVTDVLRPPLDYVAVADPVMLRAGGVTFYLSSPESASSLAEVD